MANLQLDFGDPAVNLKAIVDIGSNGIRFSISSIHPDHARIFPCIYKDRAAISLFDAQHVPIQSEKKKKKKKNKEIKPNDTEQVMPEQVMPEQVKPDDTDQAKPEQVNPDDTDQAKPDQPKPDDTEQTDIPDSVIHDVVFALLRFKSVCTDFHVAPENITVVATEATREAPNSTRFRNAILAATGWPVLLLSKSDEARYGSLGVLSSFHQARGLFMDLGGGSTQLSWVSCSNGEINMSTTPVSLPYGAAALTRRLLKQPPQSVSVAEATELIYTEIETRLRDAFSKINVPQEMQMDAEQGGFKLYLSGGGFRGLGNLLLSQTSSGPQPSVSYPIPIINGFSCTPEPLIHLVSKLTPTDHDTPAEALAHHQQTITGNSQKLFRISQRRAHQLPAVLLLVRALLAACPFPLRKLLFSQGGVREGLLFHSLSIPTRAQDPLTVATLPLRSHDAHIYDSLLINALPSHAPTPVRTRLLPALANTAFTHSLYPKEIQPAGALLTAVSGVLAPAHAISHEMRALLGIALCYRWGGELPDPAARKRLCKLVLDQNLAWWAAFLGHVLHVLGGVYPGGKVTETEHFVLMAEQNGQPKSGAFTLRIVASAVSPKTAAPMVRSRINNLEKKLKKLTKEFGNDGCKVNVVVEWVNQVQI